MAWAVAVVLGLLGAGRAHAADFVYTVQPGDHFWNIGQRYLNRPGQALALARLNQIADPRRLMPGTQLHIPAEWLRLQSSAVLLQAVAGEVSLVSDAAGTRPAVAGEALTAPVRLRTGPTGSASLKFADGSQVLLLRDSELDLRSSATRLLDQAGMVTLQLLRGGMENQVRPRQPQGGRFEIRTPAATAAVRGTRFRVHADDTGAPRARTEVLEGAVQIANATGTVTAGAAQGSVAEAGHAPAAPVPLLPAPDLSGLPERVERLQVDLPFAALAGAQGYRAQVAPDAAFTHLLLDDKTTEPRLRLRDLADGSYLLRVRGIDGQGLEGLSAERRLVLHAQPPPPLQIEPAPDAVTTAARPLFRWTEAGPGTRYRLQVGQAGQAEPLVDRVVDSGSAEPERELAPGRYAWRVASIDASGRQGPFSDMVAFRRLLPGPDAQVPVPEDGSLVLRWRAQPNAAAYRLQLAADADFGAPSHDLRTDALQHSVRGLLPGVHRVRMQTIDANGEAGPWGDPQTFTVPEPAAAPRWPLLLLLLPLVLL